MTSKPDTQQKLDKIGIAQTDADREYGHDMAEDILDGDGNGCTRQELERLLTQWACKIRVETLLTAPAQLGAASPEPVAWRWRYDNQFWAFRSTRPKHADDVDVTCEPLYTHPPASPPTGDDCSCGGGDISGHDALCPERSQEERC